MNPERKKRLLQLGIAIPLSIGVVGMQTLTLVGMTTHCEQGVSQQGPFVNCKNNLLTLLFPDMYHQFISRSYSDSQFQWCPIVENQVGACEVYQFPVGIGPFN